MNISEIAYKPVVVTNAETKTNTLGIIVGWSESNSYTANQEATVWGLDIIDIDKTVENGEMIFQSFVVDKDQLKKVFQSTSVLKKPSKEVYEKIAETHEIIKGHVEAITEEMRICTSSVHSIGKIFEEYNEELIASMYNIISDDDSLIIGFSFEKPLTKEQASEVNDKVIQLIREYTQENIKNLEENLEQFLDTLEYEVINLVPDGFTIEDMICDREQIKKIILNNETGDLENE